MFFFFVFHSNVKDRYNKTTSGKQAATKQAGREELLEQFLLLLLLLQPDTFWLHIIIFVAAVVSG